MFQRATPNAISGGNFSPMPAPSSSTSDHEAAGSGVAINLAEISNLIPEPHRGPYTQHVVNSTNSSLSTSDSILPSTFRGSDAPNRKMPSPRRSTATMSFFDLQYCSPSTQLAICVFGVFFFYLIQAYLQEYIFKALPGFRYGWYLTFFQFIASALLSQISREYQRDTLRKAPMLEYLIMAFGLVSTKGLSNTACVYLNYPTQVIFKSSKLIPVMIGGIIVMRKRYSIMEYIAAVLLSLSLVLFALSDSMVSPSFDITGVILMMGALVADAFVGNLQERSFKLYGASENEMVFYCCTIGCVYLLAIMYITDELGPAVAYSIAHPTANVYFILFAITGYFGVSFVLGIIRLCDAVVAMTITNVRKVVTIGLSFVLFPKPFTVNYLLGAALFFVAITLHVYARNKPQVVERLTGLMARKHSAAQQTSSGPQGSASKSATSGNSIIVSLSEALNGDVTVEESTIEGEALFA